MAAVIADNGDEKTACATLVGGGPGSVGDEWYQVGSNFSIEPNCKQKATMKKKGYSTAFSSVIVRSDEYCEWTVKIANRVKSGQTWCYIGIASKMDCLNKDVLSNCINNITYWSGGDFSGPAIYYKFEPKTDEKPYKYKKLQNLNSYSLCHGNIVKLILDTTKNELTFIRTNDFKTVDTSLCKSSIELKTVCKIPELKDKSQGWRLYGNMYYSGDSVQILSCEHRHNTILSLERFNDGILGCLEAIKRNNGDLEGLYKHLDLPTMFALKDSIDSHNKTFNCETSKFKEYNDEVKKIDEIIESKILPNALEYEKWDALTIVTFIVALNPEFVVYKTKLLDNLINQSFDGSCLGKLEKNDLLGLGIDNFTHRTQMYGAIVSLRQGTFQTPSKSAQATKK